MAPRKHGHAPFGATSPTYRSWAMMVQRCTNPRHDAYRYYGARGLSVCDRWRESFAAFLDDMGERPVGTTLDRIDNAKGYEPGNCRWATQREQNRNRKGVVFLEHDGCRLTVTEWSEKLAVPRKTIWTRIYKGWPVERVLAVGGG
jgi:hypothetical protein